MFSRKDLRHGVPRCKLKQRCVTPWVGLYEHFGSNLDQGAILENFLPRGSSGQPRRRCYAVILDSTTPECGTPRRTQHRQNRTANPGMLNLREHFQTPASWVWRGQVNMTCHAEWLLQRIVSRLGLEGGSPVHPTYPALQGGHQRASPRWSNIPRRLASQPRGVASNPFHVTSFQDRVTKGRSGEAELVP